jgi:CD36 family
MPNIQPNFLVSGGPFLASFPHFYMGDPALRSGIEGLNPTKEKHQFFIDIHDVSTSVEETSRARKNIEAFIRT